MMKFILIILTTVSVAAWADDIRNFIDRHNKASIMKVQEVDSGFKLLEELVKNKSTKTLTVDEISELLTLSILLMKQDKDTYAAELTYELYNKHKSLFEENLNKRDQKERELYFEKIRVYRKGLEKGNG